MKRKGLELLGVIPYRSVLARPSMDLIREELKADCLNAGAPTQDVVDSVVIGAMAVQNAIRHFKRGVLVITPADRVDILLAAAIAPDNPDQHLAGVILTGDFKPQAAVSRIIEKLPFPILRADDNIYEVASAVHNLTVKTRRRRHGENLGHPQPGRRACGCAQNPESLATSTLMNLPFSLNPVLENLPVYQPGQH